MWKFLVKQQKIEIMEREVIASEQIAFISLKFIFDGDWRKFHKVVQFTQCDETYNRVLGLDNTSCLLPAELHAGTVKMSIFGYDTETDKGIRATTVPVTLNIRPSGFVSDGKEEIPPTPDLYEQLLQRLEEKASSLQNGFDGKDGLSAYEIAIENGYNGTVPEWLDSLKGKKGDTGLRGEKGSDGHNGKSAYEIWLELGNSGTETDFLDSLKGNTGQNGISPSVSLTEQENGILMSITDAENTKTALIKHGNNENVDLTSYATKDEVGQQIQTVTEDINNKWNSNAGKVVTGKVYTVDDTQYTAGMSAEVFNNYESNIAIGSYSHAEGAGTIAKGSNSHAEGAGTKAEGPQSHSEGGGTKAIGPLSHAEGNMTVASGNFSHAEGFRTTAEDTGSHAEGQNTIARNGCSHSEGYETTAEGTHSHAEGYKTIASGYMAHAEGNQTTANGDFSHAEGQSTIAKGNHSHVIGKYNVEDTEGKFAFIIGNGSSDERRSNAFAIDWNGNIYVRNSVLYANLVDMSMHLSSLDNRVKSLEAKVSELEGGANV